MRGPSKAQLQAARGRQVPDLIAPGLRVLFCGINPSLYSAVVGHHFARPGNRFWPTLHSAGFTNRQLAPREEQELLDYGLGITNVIERASAAASELAPSEYAAGGKRLLAKLEAYQPRCLAVLGIGAYRTAFGARHAGFGRQTQRLAGTPVWVLPNPSGLNAHYQLPELTAQYGRLRDALEAGEL